MFSSTSNVTNVMLTHFSVSIKFLKHAELWFGKSVSEVAHRGRFLFPTNTHGYDNHFNPAGRILHWLRVYNQIRKLSKCKLTFQIYFVVALIKYDNMNMILYSAPAKQSKN